MRFRPRMVQRTIADRLRTELDTLGWITAPINFASVPVTVLEMSNDDVEVVLPNTVVVTLGDEPALQEVELGGMRSIGFPVYIDVYGDNTSIAVALASDIKDVFADMSLLIRDYTTLATGVESNELLEFSQLEVVRPANSVGATDFRRSWRVVRALATAYVP